MKKLLLAIPSVLGSVVAFAEETSGSSSGEVAFTGSAAETIVNDAAGTLTNFLEGVAPVLGGIVVAGLVVWGALKLVPIIKSAFSAGKGR